MIEMRRISVTIALTSVLMIGTAANPGQQGCAGNTATTAHQPGNGVPDTTGEWAIAYDDTLAVAVNLGGVTYNATIPAAGGPVEVEHGDNVYTFDLDCARPEVLCPSEAWPEFVTLVQVDNLVNQVTVSLPGQFCDGELVAAESCGEGTLNPDCDEVCDGEVVETTTTRYGSVSNDGQKFTVVLGAGAASNGVNCAAIALSGAEAQLATTGTKQGGDWIAHGMDAGTITVGYAGGCLWAGDPDKDGEMEALVLGASIVFETGFTGVRAD